MAATAKPDFSYEGLSKSDAALVAAPPPTAWRALPSAEVVATTKAALEKNGWSVTVVKNGADALAALAKFASPDATYSSGTSLSLDQIGWTAWLKANPSAWKRNFKGEAAEAESKGDYAGAGAARAQGASADWYFSSVVAVTQAGEVNVVDLTGTRVTGFLAAGHLVVLASANKIVPTLDEAAKRLNEFALPLESARVRIAYGAPASTVSNSVTLAAPNPWAPPGKRHIVIVTDEALGY